MSPEAGPDPRVVRGAEGPGLRILMLEDRLEDAELVEREIRRTAIAYVKRHAKNRTEYLQALADFHPDIILADFDLPDINGFQALQLARGTLPEVPVVVVTGSINEETAVDCILAGAADYVLKDHLVRLGPAITGAISRRKIQIEKERAEEALVESRDFYLSLLEEFPALVWRTGPHGSRNYFNAQWLAFRGRSAEEEAEGGWFSGVHREDADLLKAAFADAFKSRTPFELEYRLERGDGEYRWVLDVGKPFRGLDGQFAGYLGSCVDISARKQAEQYLRRSEERYRRLFERNLAGVFRASRTGQIEDCNPAFASMLGFASPSAAVHSALPNLLAGPGGWNALVEQIEREGSFSAREVSFVGLLPGGPVETLLSASWVVPEEGGEGRVEGTLMDITTLRRGQREMTLLSTAIKRAWEAVIILDGASKVVYVNPAFGTLTGYSSEELLGRDSQQLFSGEAGVEFESRVRNALETGQAWSGHTVWRRKDGAAITVHLTLSPIPGATRETSASVGVARDITGELALQERLARARRLETFGLIAGGVAHEVRNPLFAISTVVAAMEKKLAGQVEITPFIAHIQTHVQRLSRLMNDLLMLGRPIEPAQFVACDLGQILESALHDLEDERAGNRARFHVALGDAPLEVSGQPERLGQALLNVCQNALYFSPPETFVEVSGWRRGGEVGLRIENCGPPIPQEILGQVFDPFVSSRKGGTGLGLAIVHQVVTAHGGRVSAVNRAEGVGALFEITLPARSDLLLPAPPPPVSHN